jgi:hypothetical protein
MTLLMRFLHNAVSQEGAKLMAAQNIYEPTRPVEFPTIGTYVPADWYAADVFLARAIYHIANVHGWRDDAITELNKARELALRADKLQEVA